MSFNRRLKSTKVLVFFGLAFTAFGLTLGLASYVVPQWYTYNYPPGAGASWIEQTRTRGIFQECLWDRTATPTMISPYVNKGGCIENDVGQYSYTSNDAMYWMDIKLRISQLVLHGISLVFALVIFILGMGIFFKWCGEVRDTIYYIHWRLAFGVVLLLNFFIMAASPSIGIVLSYIEQYSSFPLPNLPYTQAYNNNIQFIWGSMFIAAWVSVGCYLIAAVFFLISVCIGERLEEQKYKPQVYSLDNLAYNADGEKSNQPIFFTPSSASTFRADNGNVAPNDTVSPGLLPRYNIN